MTRTYEELYNRYISEEINFPIIKNGTLRICQFITLKKVFQKKNGKLKKKNKIDELVETTIKEFEKVSKDLINIIKTGDLERMERKKITFISIILEEFEFMKNCFNTG